MPACGLGLSTGRAIALVSKAHRVGGRGGVAYGGEDGTEALVVSVGGIAGVDGTVAKAVMLGDKLAALLARVERHREAGHEQVEASLALGAKVGEVDD